jgi:Ni/Co efflux regulator RcnB/surface antigen
VKKFALCAMAALMLTSPVALAQRSDRNQDNDRARFDRDRYDRNWSRGERLPSEYRQPRFIFNDWRERGLRRPPGGYVWIHVGNQFILAQRSSGRISEVHIAGQGRVDNDDRRYRGDGRNERWRARYSRSYALTDDNYYQECRNQPDPAGVIAGAVLGGLLGNAAGGRRSGAGPTVAGVIAGGAIGAALTAKLDCEDRSYAYKTYSDGFSAGRANATYQWRNPRNNHRGEMRVLDYYNDEDRFRCAAFSQTVYINGRPEEARGRACQQPDGTWVIID